MTIPASKILRLFFAGSGLVYAAGPDAAIVTAMLQSQPVLKQIRILQRAPVEDNLHLVIAVATPASAPSGKFVWWSNTTALGLFLQSVGKPDLVYTIAVEKGTGDGDCSASIERMTSNDTVISCKPEKGWQRTHRKFIYDVGARSLFSRVEYDTFKMRQVRVRQDRAIVYGGNAMRQVALEYKPSTVPALRIIDLKEPSRPPERSIANPPQEGIGPTHTVDGRMWFGKKFYDGEGYTGTGSFGYIDKQTRQQKTYTPPEIARWSTSAILIEPDAVWLGLVHYGEWRDSSGGLLRFNRETEAVTRFELPDIAAHITRVGDRLVIATDFGVAILNDGGKLQRYFVDQTSDGRLRVVEAIGSAEHP
jgi:hypothetical protein